ncbi:hypothetical protein [Pseudomonas sp. TWI929]|uniref:hypothetical protein n=1 Tax=Pseudomonas sp. TWI929 TaxID=3136795 RepID=UPI0032091147
MKYRIQLVKNGGLKEVLHFDEEELICKYFNVGNIIMDESRAQNGSSGMFRILSKNYTSRWVSLVDTCWMTVEEVIESQQSDLYAQMLAQKD